MELWDNSKAAFEAGMKQFFKQQSDDPLYIYQIKLGKSTFFTVLSTGQITKYKLKKQDAIWSIGLDETTLKHKRSLKELKPTEEAFAIQRALKTYHQAKGRLDKLIDKNPTYSKLRSEAGAESGKPTT